MGAAAAIAGCSVVPDIPHEAQIPVGEILLSATCGLQTSFKYLDRREFSRFHAKLWLISVALLPKVDSDFAAGAGYGGKSSSITKPYSSSWVIGAAPGLSTDTKGERSSGVTLKIKSADLINSREFDCGDTRPTFIALSNNLGLHDWLERSAIAVQTNPVAKIDSPNYNSDITIKFSGDGSYSYAFPFGGALVAASGSYSVDEQLQISMTPIDPPAKQYHVRTLPVAGLDSTVSNNATASATAAANQRLDFQQLQTTLRTLKVVQ